MLAAVYERYGPPEVVQLREVPKPAPAPDELLVRVRAATVAAGDWRMRKADPFLARLFNGLFRPRRVRILGFELSGEVEAVGSQIQRFQPGDRVFAFTGFRFGAHAEYCCLKERGPPTKVGLVSAMPSNMSFEEAAAMPVGALTAQAFLREAGLASGARVLIYGASGSVGTFAVQLAKHAGAHVTAVAGPTNQSLVKSLGADEVIDYTKGEIAEGRAHGYDVVFDAVGKCPRALARRLQKPGGRVVSVKGSSKLEPADLDSLRALAETGALRSLIDRTFTFAQIVEAHRYVEAGHKRGNVVLGIAPV